MLKLSSIMVGTSQPEKLTKFYRQVFGKEPDMQEKGWAGWALGGGFFSIGEHSKVKGKSKEPERVIFNLETDKVEEEFARMKKLGVRVIQEPYNVEGSMIATLQDIDGNFFQLMSPWK